MDNVKAKINSWQLLADIFLKEDKRVFITDYSGSYYFADILLVGENTITISCFGPKDRAGQKFNLYWAAIQRFEEYKQKGGLS